MAKVRQQYSPEWEIDKVPVLDHGYIGLVESWGSDERIVEAARMSTDKGFQGWGDSINPGDERLLNHLWKNKHASPFEMGGLIVELQAPIFVFREWHRHRTQSYNELSARYTPMPDVNYTPSLERCLIVNSTNKQANTLKGADVLTHEAALDGLEQIHDYYEYGEALYQRLLKIGFAKELARIVIPVGRYSRMRAQANLRNWLAFTSLRMDTTAQWEIRMYANLVGTFIQKTFPRTWEIYLSEQQKNNPIFGV